MQKLQRHRRRKLMRLAGVATMLTVALITTSVPIQAQENRATERAVDQAQDAVQVVDQTLKEAQNAAKQDTDRTEKKAEGKEKDVQETTVVTVPESGGISTGNLVLLALGSALIIGAWLFARREAR
jgi:mannitol-specific phosphotransferase system IIBC component